MTQSVDSLLVLIVDDEEVDRLNAARLVTKLGHSVAQASNGKEAIAFCAALIPDVIFLDLMMADLDGYGTCSAIRLLPGGKAAPIYALTGTDRGDFHRLHGAGFDGYLVKPLDTSVLERLLRPGVKRTGRISGTPNKLDLETAELKTLGESLSLAEHNRLRSGYDPYAATPQAGEGSKPRQASSEEEDRKQLHDDFVNALTQEDQKSR